MHWYGGSIAEAVSLSKQKNAIFVVFVEGDNDLSQEMAQTIDNTVVVSRLSSQTNFLAIKLKSGSTNYTHFAQIYQFVPVPSLFFIGRNGTPLEVVCAGVEANNLATRIDRILEEHRKEKSPLVQPSTSSQNIKEQTENLLQSEAASSALPKPEPVKVAEPRAKEPESSEPAAKIPKTDKGEDKKAGEYEVVCDGDVCVRRPKVSDGPGTSKQAEPVQMETEVSAVTSGVPDTTAASTVASNDPPAGTSEPQVSPTDSVQDIEDKLERAKELIEARRREKADKEKELEKQKEIERRAAGKGVNELKKWQADQELKQIQEERKREKLENNLARQRILEQIAQDRAERRARDAPPPPAPPAAPTSPAPMPATSGDGGTRARIQFKLPDGSSHTAHFDAEDTLADVQRYVADNLQLPSSSFSLWTAFPRRELGADAGGAGGAGASLRALQLAPSAALLVLPRRAPAAVAAPSAFANIITFFTQLFATLVLEPSQQLYEWLRRRVLGAASPRDRAPSPPPPAPPAPSSAAPAPPTPPAPGARRRGNIHRLPGDRGGDDDNNTWNGNSTQQM